MLWIPDRPEVTGLSFWLYRKVCCLRMLSWLDGAIELHCEKKFLDVVFKTISWSFGVDLFAVL